MALLRMALRDFVIVQALDLDLNTGFSALTGETGAGKSILIDAVQFVLGARADTGSIPKGLPAAKWQPNLTARLRRKAGCKRLAWTPMDRCCCAAPWTHKAKAAPGSMAARSPQLSCANLANSCWTFMVSTPGKA